MDTPFPPLDPSHTALLVHDMQKEYLGDADSRPDPIAHAVERTLDLIDQAHTISMPVIYVKGDTDPRIGNPPDRAEYFPQPSEGTCLVGTESAELIDELTPTDEDFIVTKFISSSFYNTNLEGLLRAQGVWVLILVGGSTEWGIEWVGRDARPRFIVPIAVEDCTYTARGEEVKQASLRNFDCFLGHVMDSDAVIEMLAEYETGG